MSDDLTAQALMAGNPFKKAVRTKTILRMGIAGPAGSGKSYTAIGQAMEIARLVGWGRVAVVDSERGSASLYSGGKPYDFDVLELEEFHPNSYIVALKAAENAVDEKGQPLYSVIVLDGISQAWEGTEGMLEQKERSAKKAGYNEWSAWRDITPMHNRFVDAMLTSRLHLIATMRVKTEWVLEPNEKGKQVPKKVGLAPRFRAGIEHEFGVVGTMDDEHNLTITKTRCPSIDGKVYFRPDAGLTAVLWKWLREGEDFAPRNILPAGAGVMLAGVTPQPPPPGTPPTQVPAAYASGGALDALQIQEAVAGPLSPGVDVPAMEGKPATPLPEPTKPQDAAFTVVGDAREIGKLSLSAAAALAKAIDMTGGGAKGVLSFGADGVKIDVLSFVDDALKACTSEAECKALGPSMKRLTPDRLAVARVRYEARVRELRQAAQRAAGATA